MQSNVVLGVCGAKLGIAKHGQPLKKTNSADLVEAYVGLLEKQHAEHVDSWLEDVLGPVVDYIIDSYLINR